MNNEVKKILYKENPKAYLQRTYDEGYTYLCDTSIGDIYFFIPIEECFYEGKNIFSDEMPAKELIRWIEPKEYKPVGVLFNGVTQGVFKDEDETLVVDINKLASNIKELDIVNCQPWLLSNIVDDENFKKVCSEGKIYEEFMNIDIINLEKQLSNYDKESIEYKELNNKITKERNRVKKLFYKLLFGSYQKKRIIYYIDLKDTNSLLNKFINKFPKVWDYIEEINSKEYTNLCKVLQRKESELILDNIWNILNNNNISALTIHDSICIEEKNYEKTKDIIIEEITKKGYTIPKFK